MNRARRDDIRGISSDPMAQGTVHEESFPVGILFPDFFGELARHRPGWFTFHVISTAIIFGIARFNIVIRRVIIGPASALRPDLYYFIVFAALSAILASSMVSAKGFRRTRRILPSPLQRYVARVESRPY